ncbi:MAG: hypothetical protein KKA16_09310 [Alphaproteobacteria bacterium]|nr:hypothetical protein [Alphaproteobacteria bacterium]
MSIVALSRRERASDLRIQADPLPEIGDRDRETSAFWFRRITTAILLGNGAGVIAIGSYIADGKDNADTLGLAYPAMASFLSGIVLGFICYLTSYISTSMRLEAYVEIINRAAELARNAGKKTATTQHDGMFFFLILLVVAQIFFIIGSGASFYNGSSYVLSVLGQAACSKKQETYCYGTPILFPFADPYDPPDLDPDASTATPSRMLTPADFTLEASVDGEGRDTAVSRLTLAVPPTHTLVDVTSSDTAQLTASNGDSCLFRTHWFSNGGTALIRSADIDKIRDRLRSRGYSFFATSSQLFAVTMNDVGSKYVTVLNADLNGDTPTVAPGFDRAPISLVPFLIEDDFGLAIYSEANATSGAIECLRLASDAGFELDAPSRRILAAAEAAPQP